MSKNNIELNNEEILEKIEKTMRDMNITHITTDEAITRIHLYCLSLEMN